MEKIMNLQMPGSMPSGAQTRPVQSSDSADGFLKLLQQKQESSAPDPKTEDTKAPVKDSKSDAEEEPKKAPAEEEEPADGMQQLAQELAAQQAAVQQTVVTPDWQEQTAAAETVVEAAVEEIPMELPVQTVKPQVTEQTEVQEPAKAEVSAKPVEDLTVQQQVVPKTKTEENNPETFLTAGQSSEPVQESVQPKETVRETAGAPVREESSEEGEETKAVYSQSLQSTASVRTEAPVREEAPEGTVMKATVEELPEELGKALASGRAADSQTLTVELEPASLGRLTIRVDYEAGRAAVSILASNPKTLEILSEKASEIASILKEHTGEETVIYTQEAQRQDQQDQYDGRQGGSRGGQEEQRQQKQEERHEAESFAQQLRLGLV